MSVSNLPQPEPGYEFNTWQGLINLSNAFTILGLLQLVGGLILSYELRSTAWGFAAALGSVILFTCLWSIGALLAWAARIEALLLDALQQRRT